MVPRVDNDFVFTISDNDDVSTDEEFEVPTTKLSGRGKKRKHADDGDDTIDTVKKNKKARKEAKKQKKKAKLNAPTEADKDVEEDEEEVIRIEGEDNDDIASDFEFQIGGMDNGVLEDFDGWGGEKAEVQAGQKRTSTAVDVDEIIERRRQKKGDGQDGAVEKEEKQDEEFGGFGDADDELLAEDGFGMGVGSDVEEESAEEDEEGAEKEGSEQSDADGEDDNEEGSEDEVAVHVPHPMDLQTSEAEDESEEEDPEEAKKRAEFFAPEDDVQLSKQASKIAASFQGMSLSRPILKGLASVGFTEPTPIQSKTIPMALQGKDVVGGAVTGSGKTGAFIIPILERLLYRPKKIPQTRVAILMPTRELAVQCFNVAQKLSSFTDITFAQLVGGFSVREQEAVLKSRPDVVIATPGRFIDHMRNSASFAVDTLEILVLDEADRMLEEGFADELNEILTTIPKSRQTMLFSATMTDSVDKLVRVGMNRPVRLLVDAKKQSAAGLTQEFVRLRPGREGKRLAYLMYLCENIYTDRVIIFFRQKKEAHRVRVVFGLCGLKAAELHGGMSQEQRIQAVESFRSGKAAFLLATDLASRGLDIKNVTTVLNYEAPQSHEIYLHRVGRTARAGRTGRSCTLAAEPDRKVVKAAVKSARAQGAKVVSRQVPADEVDAWEKKLEGLEDEIEEVLEEEKEERALSITERDLKRGENLIVHEAEIKSRPKRTWFESEKQKKQAKEKGFEELNGLSAKKEKKKLSGKNKKKLELRDQRTEGKMWKKGKEDRGKKTVKSSKGKDAGAKNNKPKKAGKPKR